MLRHVSVTEDTGLKSFDGVFRNMMIPPIFCDVRVVFSVMERLTKKGLHLHSFKRALVAEHENLSFVPIVCSLHVGPEIMSIRICILERLLELLHSWI